MQNWTRLKQPTLLKKRVSELGLQIPGSGIEPLIQKFYGELTQKGLTFHPPCFIGDEWYCPVGVPAIGIPFFLVHPRLRRLEKKIIFEVEGGTKSEFMRLLRHEAGHAYSYAYNLHKKRKWIQLFGHSGEEYPDEETYRYRPYSRNYVVHLAKGYAQSHPDEDFAETFAVWLTPNFKWRRHYKGWKKALEKLEYVDQLMKSLVGKNPIRKPDENPQKHCRLGMKLETYYARKRKLYEEDFPEFYDNDLKRLFHVSEGSQDLVSAARYLKGSRERIMDAVCLWTKEKKYTVDGLLKRLIERCRELRLSAQQNQELDYQVSAFIASLVMNYSYTGRFKRKT